jgi:hypothetical protein
VRDAARAVLSPYPTAQQGRNTMAKGPIPAVGSLLALALMATPAAAEPRPVVVELFTSQGCSSCPPADALLRELARQGEVLALGFHISYWDRLGWKDPLSSEAATARQRSYARRFNGGQVYTPQMVIDGTAEMVGSDRDAVLAALAKIGHEAVVPVAFAADRRAVMIGRGPGSGDILLARFVRHRTTSVGAGENSGRILEDANGVEGLTRLGSWDGTPLRFDIDPPGVGEGLAVLVQASDGHILGAAQTPAGPQ